MTRTPDPKARAALLDAARVEFCKSGIEGARIEDIAKRAGLSKGAFYLHFESKEEVFDILVQRLVGVMDEIFAASTEREHALLAEHGEPTVEDAIAGTPRYCAWLECHRALDLALLEVFWRQRELLSLIQRTVGISDRWSSLVDGFRQRVVQHLLGDLEAAKARGSMKPGLQIDAVTDVIVGAYEAFLTRMPSLKTKPDLQAWSDTVHEVLHKGLLPSAAAGPGGMASPTG